MAVRWVYPNLDPWRRSFQLAIAAGVVAVAMGVQQIVQVRPVQTKLLQSWFNRPQRRIGGAAIDQGESGAPYQVQVNGIPFVGRLNAKDPIGDSGHMPTILRR